MIELSVCVSHVPVVCDDGGCVGGNVGGCLSPSLMSTLSLAALFCLLVGGPRSRGPGWLATAPCAQVQRRRHHTRCTGFSGMYSLATLTSNTAHENQNRSVGTGDVVHA